MKRFLVLLACWLLFFQARAQDEGYSASQQPYIKARIIKVNILSPIVQTFTGAYESTFNHETSIQFTVSLSQFGYLFTPEYRFYLSETPAPKGVYVAPFLRYMDFGRDGEQLGGGLVIGRQGFLKSRVTFDAFIGPTYNTFLLNEEFTRFGLRAGLTLGLNVARR